MIRSYIHIYFIRYFSRCGSITDIRGVAIAVTTNTAAAAAAATAVIAIVAFVVDIIIRVVFVVATAIANACSYVAVVACIHICVDEVLFLFEKEQMRVNFI